MTTEIVLSCPCDKTAYDGTGLTHEGHRVFALVFRSGQRGSPTGPFQDQLRARACPPLRPVAGPLTRSASARHAWPSSAPSGGKPFDFIGVKPAGPGMLLDTIFDVRGRIDFDINKVLRNRPTPHCRKHASHPVRMNRRATPDNAIEDRDDIAALDVFGGPIRLRPAAHRARSNGELFYDRVGSSRSLAR